MAAPGVLIPMIHKLEALQDHQEISDLPKLKKEIERSTQKLREAMKFLEDQKDKSGEHQSVRDFLQSLLRPFYTAEDKIDTFLLKRTTKQHRGSIPYFLKGLSSWPWLRACLITRKQILKHVENISNVQDPLAGQPPPSLTESSIASRTSTSGVGPSSGDQPLTLEVLTQVTVDLGEIHFLTLVVGEPGSGKTTLVRKLYNSKEIEEHFKCRVWVHLSKEFEEEDMEKCLVDILKQVNEIQNEDIISKPSNRFEVSRLNVELVKVMVRDKLIRQRYLIVLDGVCKPEVWDCLKDVLLDPLNGSRAILITNNQEEVAEKINYPRALRLPLGALTEKEARSLFSEKVVNNKCSIDDELTKQIIETCKRLPAAISVLAGVLSTKKDKGQWPEVIRRASIIDKDPLDAIIDLAYNDLPSSLRPCLLYLGMFPKESPVSTRRLIHLWAAEGFLHPQKEKIAEDVAEEFLDELLRRNLIEVVERKQGKRPKEIRVPGILYDHVLSDAAKTGFFHIHGHHHQENEKSPSRMRRVAQRCTCFHIHGRRQCHENQKSPSNIRRVAEHCTATHPFDKDFKFLRTYVSMKGKGEKDAYEAACLFFKGLISRGGFAVLAVLDLEHVYKPELSKGIQKLLLLKYLGLRWTSLDSIPDTVGHLPQLETLDVRHTCIASLPKSIWNSKTLQHLYADQVLFDPACRSCKQRLYADQVLFDPACRSCKQRLYADQVLFDQVLFDPACRSCKQRLYADQVLFDPACRSCKHHDGSWAKLLTLRGLVIRDVCPDRCWLERVTNLRKLVLTCNYQCLKTIRRWILGMTSLRSLTLRLEKKDNPPTDKDTAPELFTLKDFSNHCHLSSLSLVGKLLPDAIGEVQLLHELKFLTFSMSTLKEDPMLVLSQLPRLEALNLFASSYAGKEINCPAKGFPELRILKLWNLDELEKLTIHEGSMPNLRELEIRRCTELKKCIEWKHLRTLEVLVLTNMSPTFADHTKRSVAPVEVRITNLPFYPLQE